MPNYVAFLRATNVGRNSSIKMASECPCHPKDGEVVHVTILDKKPTKNNVMH